MNPFETETMADLQLRQGHRADALAIYRRLLARTTDQAARERLARRIFAVESAPPGAAGQSEARDIGPAAVDATRPMTNPSVRAWRSGDDRLSIEWRLPAEVRQPALEVLLVRTSPTGVSTETRAIGVSGNAGRLTLGTGGLHSARVAAGNQGPRGFVPFAMAACPPPSTAAPAAGDG